MKKQFLAILCALGVIASVAPAKAGCDGLYLSGKVGIVNHNLGDNEETFGNRLAIDDNAWILAGAIGYRFYGYWRIEAEYTWRQKSKDKETIYSAWTQEEFESASYMANLYLDLSPYTMFTPYLMAGIGMTHLEYTFSGSSRANNTLEADNFTWAVGAGLSAKMTNRWNIDLGYRFLNMGKFDEATVRAHEVYLGMRYVFPM